MESKKLRSWVGAVVVGSAVGVVHASDCGRSNQTTGANKGNFLCTGCTFDSSIDGHGNLFIKSVVNAVPRQSGDGSGWKKGEYVILTNGTTWVRYSFTPPSSIFQITASGWNQGPGDPINHNGQGKTCAQLKKEENGSAGSGSGGGSGAGGGSGSGEFASIGSPSFNNGGLPSTYMPGDYTSGPTGIVTGEHLGQVGSGVGSGGGGGGGYGGGGGSYGGGDAV